MLALSIGRATARDPMVNGYTRRRRGQLARVPYGPAIKAGPGANDTHRLPVASFAGVVHGSCTQLGDTPQRSLCGYELGTVLVYHGERGASGGPELWVDGVYTGFAAQTLNATQLYKIAVDGTTTRVWVDGGLWLTQIFPGAARGTASQYLQTDGNSGATGLANFANISAAIDNALHFARCPAGGFVVVTVNGGAPVTVNLDGAGTGALDLGATLFPFALTVDIQNAAHASQAQLYIPGAYGGDEYGLLH